MLIIKWGLRPCNSLLCDGFYIQTLLFLNDSEIKSFLVTLTRSSDFSGSDLNSQCGFICLVSLMCDDRFEHPAGGYKKMFETCEELSEPVPATVIGWFPEIEIDCSWKV